MTGVEAFLEILAGAGVSHLFGNPGTTELPLNDAVGRDPRFRYVFGLHEIPVTAAADGYALASRKIGVVNLHTACGLGNAMGMIYNAHCAGSPLLITAGQQDTRLLFDEPVITGPLVEMARPLVKWAAEVHRVEDLPNATRRAIQMALTPPTGPVFLSLPIDVQMAVAAGLDTSPPWLPDRRVRPAVEPLQQAAQFLANAKNPVILAGSRVTVSGGVAELVSLAEALGAHVFNESAAAHGRLPFPTGHPLYRGPLPLWSEEVRKLLAPYDVALVVGMNLLRLYIVTDPARPIPESMKLVQFDVDPAQVGKNFPVEVGFIGDLKEGLAELAVEVEARLTEPQRSTVRERLRLAASQREASQASFRAKIEQQASSRPMTSRTLMAALARVLPRDVAIVQEAPTSHHNVLEKLGAIPDPAGYFAHRGWALGWGVGCALGVKLAWPGRPVLALIGDGAAMYGIQGLWTAARHNLPVTFVVCNNARYKILQVCGDVLKLDRIADASAPGLVLDSPAIDFVGLAAALGVEAHNVSEPEDLSAKVQSALAGSRPVLFNVPIAD
jgi:benzoylformate decarboxylase